MDVGIFRQLASYFCVGFVAASVNWVSFYFFMVFNLHYMPATIIAFIIATLVNWYLGRIFVFRKWQSHANRELALVFFVSVVGLGLDVTFMCVLVEVVGLNEGLYLNGAKVISTGLGFLWNFGARKMIVYRNVG